jgi:NADPH-dependent 2,4-dienoyl-CoA reductase/sulfur reductase-like enzyme/peroxiredoxin family protein/rhodanese-related sulfurtransferase/TusA-related sulfurtransferase
MKTVIVGGVAGGATAAARLRRLDEHQEIILFERGSYISFANCGLPYYIGGEIKDRSKLTLQTPESFNERFNVDVRINNEALSIDPKGKKVIVKDHKLGKTYFEEYDKLILSPGAAPVRPNIEGIDNERVFTLRNIPDTYKIKDFIEREHPKKAAVIGGGYIGVEMADNLHSAGLNVTIVEFADHVIAPLDYEMACDVHNHIREKGVELILKDGVKAVRPNGNGITLTLGGKEIDCDMAILCVGVRPESDLAKNAGLALNKRGAIVVNDRMQTSEKDIFAVGDAVEITDFVTGEKGYIPLAGPANKQGRIAADNIAGLDSRYKGTQGTGVLKCFDLTVATVGITEARAKELGLSYEKSYTYSASHATYYPGAVNMSVKLLFEKPKGRILGAQIVGYDGADKRIDVLAAAIRAKMTVSDLTELELAYAPPFSSAKDPVNMAGYTAENILMGKVRVFHWNEAEALAANDKVQRLDVRTVPEYENGHIKGYINIPLDELRTRLNELDKSKPVYVMCQSGLRSYTACRILSQNSFDCFNLSGGYRLWKSVFKGTDPASLDPHLNTETMRPVSPGVIRIDACGLQCPGPIMRLSKSMESANAGATIEVTATDPAFAGDAEAWCGRTGNTYVYGHTEKGVSTVTVKKGGREVPASGGGGNGKNIIVFSGDLDKAIASFVIANAAAAMGRKVTMFFTFWGLYILRKPERVKVKKDLMSRMFGAMMPCGAKKLTLSKMNMAGMGAAMIRNVMKNKNVESLEDLIKASMENGVELVACSMSMDVMGLKLEELIDGVKPGGAAAMLANAEESDMSLFI